MTSFLQKYLGSFVLLPSQPYQIKIILKAQLLQSKVGCLKHLDLAPGRLTHFQDYEILALSKMKAFADDKLNVTQNIKKKLYRLENIDMSLVLRSTIFLWR